MTIFSAYLHALSCFPTTKAAATRTSSRTWSTLRMRNIWNILEIRSFPKPKVVCRVMMLMLEPPCVDCNKGNLYKTRDRVAGRSMRLSTFGFQLVTNSYIIWFDGSPDSTTTWSSDLGFQLSSGPEKIKQTKNAIESYGGHQCKPNRRGLYFIVSFDWSDNLIGKTQPKTPTHSDSKFKFQASDLKFLAVDTFLDCQRNQFEFWMPMRMLNAEFHPPAAATFSTFTFPLHRRLLIASSEVIPSASPKSYFPRLAEAFAYVKLIRHKINFELCA